MSGDLCTGRFSFGRCTVVLGLKKRLRAGSWPGYEIAKDSTTRPREINIGDAAWRCVTVSKRNLAKKRSHHTCTSTSSACNFGKVKTSAKTIFSLSRALG